MAQTYIITDSFTVTVSDSLMPLAFQPFNPETGVAFSSKEEAIEWITKFYPEATEAV